MTKIGFFSDVHGNLEALTAILKRLDQESCDLLVCLGDIVGYGANPSECVHILQDRDIPCVLGNHDEYATSFMTPAISRLRPEILKSIEWTQTQLSLDDMKWLAELPMRLQLGEEIVCLHSSFARGRWAYCMDEETFAANFERQEPMLAFCGHSHSPLIGIQMSGQTPFVDFIRPYTIPEGRRTMVNVGSVGQPRDRDSRACACVYEVEKRHLELIREPYDIETAQNKIYMARLPDKFGLRLAIGK
ncbi:MAG: metallophosphatase family protein [Lentisphaeria bacterium]|nr:metallophosphatase family protein [Lentisphaeria bacterium]